MSTFKEKSEDACRTLSSHVCSNEHKKGTFEI